MVNQSAVSNTGLWHMSVMHIILVGQVIIHREEEYYQV